MIIVDRISQLPNGSPVDAGTEVRLRRASDGTILATALTDINGWVTFQGNGSPGPIYTEVTIGGETRYRYGRSVAQAGTWYEGEWQSFMDMVLPGVITQNNANAMNVLAGTGLQVRVSPGTALAEGVLAKFYEDEFLSIASNGSGNPRNDLVVLQLHSGGSEIGKVQAIVVQGAPAATPVDPDVPVLSDVAQLILARVRVQSGVAILLASDITDLRPIATFVPDGSITSQKLAANSVTATQLAAGSVTSTKLGVDAVGSANIADDAILSAHIADDAILSVHLANDSVLAAALATGSVTADAIATGAVGSLELADGAVINAKLADGSVTNVKLGADSVTGAKIADNAIGSEHILAGAVTNSELGADSVTAAKIADNAIGAEHISAGAVGASEIADGAVGQSELAANAVTASHIVDGSITSTEIANGTIVEADLASAVQTKLNKATTVPTTLGGLLPNNKTTNGSARLMRIAPGNEHSAIITLGTDWGFHDTGYRQTTDETWAYCMLPGVGFGWIPLTNFA